MESSAPPWQQIKLGAGEGDDPNAKVPFQIQVQGNGNDLEVCALLRQESRYRVNRSHKH